MATYLAYTAHGHLIPGEDPNSEPPPYKMRCGGIPLCSFCNSYINPNRMKDTRMLDIQKFQRKAFDVEAVQVTLDNLEEVAKWCSGDVHYEHGDRSPQSGYVRVPVRSPQNEKQSRAYLGDWVLRSDSGLKVYSNRAFANSFIPMYDPARGASRNVFETAQAEEDAQKAKEEAEKPVEREDISKPKPSIMPRHQGNIPRIGKDTK